MHIFRRAVDTFMTRMATPDPPLSSAKQDLVDIPRNIAGRNVCAAQSLEAF